MQTPAPGRSLDGQHLELALQVAGLGEFEWDQGRDVLIVSERMAAIAGLRAGEQPAEGGEVLYRTVHAEDRESVRRCLTSAAPGCNCDVEYRRQEPAGRLTWIRLAAVLSGPQSDCLIGVVQDITDRKLEEEQRHTLMSELDHRVKNVLAAVQALAFQTAKRTTNLDSFLATFAGRLKSMGSANELLTAARWRGAAVDHLCAAELGGIAPGQTRWEGPELFLTPRAANALSLALHELATNALKYGALSTEGGRVEVRWTRQPDNGFELTWTESGGPMVKAPAHRGFGSTLLEQVTGRELNGGAQVDYRPTGVRVQLRAGPAAVVARP
ncbi:MAG TPA: HWE histidine kinase domain-containing protein, partial [Phenylobacterium sp.]